MSLTVLAALCLAPTVVQARCAGRDLFPPPDILGEADPAGINREAWSLPFRYGRLYRVLRNGRAPSYILGTVHLADHRASRLTKRARAVVAEAQIVAVETLEGSGASSKTGAAPLLAAGREQRLEHLLDPRAFAALADLTRRRGLDWKLVKLLKPAVLALSLDLPACAVGNADASYLDAEIVAAARARGTPVVGLETLQEQIGAIDGLGAEMDGRLLRAIIAQARYADDIVETTIRRYDAGDAGGLLTWMRSPSMIPGEPEAIVPTVFLDHLITRRNRKMIERIIPLVDRGGALVAVGLAHLPGAEGLLVLLKDRGLQIEAIE